MMQAGEKSGGREERKEGKMKEEGKANDRPIKMEE